MTHQQLWIEFEGAINERRMLYPIFRGDRSLYAELDGKTLTIDQYLGVEINLSN